MQNYIVNQVKVRRSADTGGVVALPRSAPADLEI